MAKICIAKLLVVALVFSATALAAQTVLQPDSAGNDSYIRSDFPGSNFASSSTLLVGKSADGASLRSLLHFDLSSVPSGNTITSAVLELYFNDSGAGASITAEVHRVTRQWEEAAVTWTQRTSGFTWVSAGGDFSGVENSTVVTSVNSAYIFNITQMVRELHNGSLDNYGFILKTPEASSNEFRGFYSSDFSQAGQRPKLTITHEQNAPPAIQSVEDNSNSTNPTLIGNNVTFIVNWTDLDSTQARIFICGTAFVNTTGCNFTTFCSTSFSASASQTCNYTAVASDNTTVPYYAGVCDNDGNCTVNAQQNFSVNHPPAVTVEQPNGGEIVNQSLGNYTIAFNVNDTDNNTLTASIYYSEVAGAKENIVVMNLNLATACTDPDGTAATTNVCTFSWNSSNIFGTFYLDITVNDSLQTGQDSSNAVFSVRSLIDSTPPNVTNAVITANLTSGETAIVTVNVTEQFIRNVTLEVNATGTITQYLMTNNTVSNYSANFTVTAVGNYSFRVLAYDTSLNVNATVLQNFTVSKPNATADRQSPATVQPSSVIIIKGILNAIDLVNGINATINLPAGFSLLAETNQTQIIGNINASGQKNASWFVSVPSAETAYTLNITFKDQYGNAFHGSNFTITVSSAVAQGGLFVDINSQVEIEAGNSYVAEIFVRDSTGVFVNADAILISLFDPLNNTIVSNVGFTSQDATGKYRYVFATSAGQTQGQWLVQVNATKGSAATQDRQFWKLTGGPFDVRNITINDNVVPALQISAILENTGGSGQDLILSWNLTRLDTGALLDSGGDSIFVPAASTKGYTITPSTSFVGQVKIVIIGTFSGTEKVGAFATFNTQLSVADIGAVSAGGGGGGVASTGVPTEITPTVKKSIKIISSEKTINIIAGETKSVQLAITNDGNVNLSNVVLTLKGLTNWAVITPVIISAIAPQEEKTFIITFTVPEDADIKTHPFFYAVSAGEIAAETRAELNMKSMKDVLFERLKLLKAETEKINARLALAEEDVSSEQILVGVIEEDITRAEKLINSKDFGNARALLDRIEQRINEVNDRLDRKKVPRIQDTGPASDMLATIATVVIIIAVLLPLAYIIRRRRPNLKKKMLESIEKAEKAPLVKPEPVLKTPPPNIDKFEKRVELLKKKIRSVRK